MFRLQQGEPIPLSFLDAGRPGTDVVTYGVARRSDGARYDFDDGVWKSSGWTALTANLGFAYDGIWRGSFTDTAFEDTLEFHIDNTTSGNEEIQLWVLGGWADRLDKGVLAHDQDMASVVGAAVVVGMTFDDVTIRVEDSGTNPMPDVLVRIYNETRTAFVAQGVTGPDGRVVCSLAPATYSVLLSRPGTTFTNPYSLQVLDQSSGPPSLVEVGPAQAFQGDVVALAGFRFNTTLGNNVVRFSTAAGGTVTTPPLSVSADRRRLTCRVPAGLGDLLTTNVAVDNGSGYSNVLPLALTRPPVLSAVVAGAGGTLDLSGSGFGSVLEEVLVRFRVISGDTGAIGDKRRGPNTITPTGINVDFPVYSGGSSVGVSVYRHGRVAGAEVAYAAP